MRFTVLGAGSIGSRHIRNLIELGVAATDITAIDPRQDALDALPVTGKREAEYDDVRAAEALLICTPAGLHRDDLATAIVEQIPFFVEKPAVLRVADLPDGLCTAANRIPHLVACNMRFRPEVSAVLEFALTVPHARAAFTIQTDMTRWPGEYGHELFECCHEIDLAMQSLGGGPVTVDEASNKFQWLLRLENAHGRVALVSINAQHKGVAFRAGAAGTKETTLKYEWHDRPPDVNDMYEAEMMHFLAVLRGTSPIHTLADARDVVQVCETAVEMAGEQDG